MYLTTDAVAQTLASLASTLAPSSTFVMSFLLPLERADAALRPGIEAAMRGAAAAGTPWLSFFDPNEILKRAKDAGFKDAHHVSADDLAARYFAGRSDGLRPPAHAEELLVART